MTSKEKTAAFYARYPAMFYLDIACQVISWGAVGMLFVGGYFGWW